MNGLRTKSNLSKYIKYWTERGYERGIPDEVPNELMIEKLAPSYKAVCICILQNDMNLYGLGFSVTKSKYYNILKSIDNNKQAY